MNDKAQWRRIVNYVAQEDGDRFPKRHTYEFTTLDTVKEVHKDMVAMLDASDTGDQESVSITGVGEKFRDTVSRVIVYSVVHVQNGERRMQTRGEIEIESLLSDTPVYHVLPDVAAIIAKAKNSG